MTDTLDSPAEASAPAPKKRSGGLNAMLLADLKAMAAGMGIAGAGAMKKAQIVEAIKSAQTSGSSAAARTRPADRSDEKPTAKPVDRGSDQPGAATPPAEELSQKAPATPEKPEKSEKSEKSEKPAQASGAEGRGDDRPQGQQKSQKKGADASSGQGNQEAKQAKADQAKADQNKNDGGQGGNQNNQNNQQGNQGNQGNQQGNQNNQGDQGDQGDEEGRGGRNRRRRGRDRTRTGPVGGQAGGGGAQRNEPDTTVLEDDVLVPAAGILDVLDNYAFVRTSGYLPGADDVYLSLSMVRKFGLRRGDAIVGQVRQPREGERKEKFNPMVRIDTVNGGDPQQAGSRPEFEKLTPINPDVRLRMETDAANVTGRAIDLAAPLGKGQRGLVLSPAKAGRTTVLKSVARSVTTNNPECHLMVVLVDERPEEVTDFERTVKGEVIASTFDRPAGDHTLVAELAIERAKRLVELGHDVVVLLDGITRLVRAYNVSAQASGRVLPGGLDAAALHPPKRFFGAARNVENGGSLTIVATAVVESGSALDEAILEEFTGTQNMELHLRGDLADRRVFPAIDPVASGTRREDLLMSEEELAIMWTFRRTLASLDQGRATDMLLSRLGSSTSNIELLMQVKKSSPDHSGVE